MDLNELTGRLTAALEGRGVTLRVYKTSETLNITTSNREMTREDVEAFRTALAANGYVEVKSWIAHQGISWLSDGTFAGVSFRVRPAS